MTNYFYIFILLGFLASGCSNQYTGLGFPYSNQDKQAKIESIEIEVIRVSIFFILFSPFKVLNNKTKMYYKIFS